MKILVTGGTGFIGSYVINSLVQSNNQVVLLKRSTSPTWRIDKCLKQINCQDIDKRPLEEILNQEKPQVIMHLAANQGRNGETLDQILKSNVVFPSELLEKSIKNGLQVFINTDTAASDLHSEYAATKKAFLPILKQFQQKSGISVLNFQLEYVFGPGDDDSKFIPFLIKSILSECSIDASPGTQKRDFIYGQDVADAYINALKLTDKVKNQFISLPIGSGHSVSLKTFAGIVANLSGKKLKIKWGALNFRKDDIMESRADITKAKNIIDWQPKHSLETAIKNTIRWYMEQN